MDYCLHNLPPELKGGTICGNGFTEDGEQCDCGLPQVKRTYVCMYVCMSTCYSAPSGFLLRGAPDYSADAESEFHAEAHEQLRVKDLPRVPTRRLEVDSNPQPSGCKAPNIPLHHRAPRWCRGICVRMLASCL